MKMFDSAEKREQNPEFTIMLDKNPLIHRGFSDNTQKVYHETPIRPAGTERERENAGKVPRDVSVRQKNTENESDRMTVKNRPADRGAYQDSVILPPGTLHRALYADAPKKIVEMMDLYQYGSDLLKEKAHNFYVQGKFMEDYEDDAPIPDDYRHYFLTYHDLNVRQLRGYFAWRTRMRRGEMQPIGESFACLYFYELLNGIGTASPEDAFQKMKDFAAGFPGIRANAAMQRNVRRWMFDFALIHEMPADTAEAYADPYNADWDRNLAALKMPETHTAGEIFDALAAVSGKNLEASPVMKKNREKGVRLFARAWEIARGQYSRDGRDIFTDCFGVMHETDYYPLRNAVYWEEKPHPDCDYRLSEMRTYSCRDGKWKVRHYERLLFDQRLFRAFVRAADAVFRRKLKTGGYLRKDPDAGWAAGYAAAAWDAELRAEAEAARPHIAIDFSELDRIRRDAAVTRDSLLVETDQGGGTNVSVREGVRADRQHVTNLECDALPANQQVTYTNGSGSRMEHMLITDPDTRLQKQPGSGTPRQSAAEETMTEVLRLLLQGASADDYMKAHHIMPSAEVDAINEAFYDEIGDSILEYDGMHTSIVEDYREDILRLVMPDASRGNG